MHAKQPIGVFDSGVGGLTVAKAIKTLLPQEDIIYFGDTKNLPYGEKSPMAIKSYAQNISRFLLELNCKAIVIACNTATANALQEVQDLVGNKALVFDVIQPIAQTVAQGPGRNVGLIATKATVNSGVYKRSIQAINPNIAVHELATPLLVPVIEEGFSKHLIAQTVIGTYLSQPALANIDSLILGCTHYPLLADEIAAFYQNKITVIDSPNIVAQHMAKVLAEKGLLQSENHQAVYHFYLSDITENFQNIAKKFFGNQLTLELKIL
jgi:glutamate racemase